MPLYDYSCPVCDEQREVQHSMNEIGKIEVFCTNCGEKMKKQLSMPTLIGFDDVGRSISKKDKVESTPKETAPVKKDAA
jgi:putative FmdB family regulatory protein